MPESKLIKQSRLRPKAANHTWQLLLRQFTSPIILILFVATVVSMVAGDAVDGIIILSIIIPSGLLGFWQEHRAGKTMDALKSRLALKARVRRGNKIVEVDHAMLRIDDVVLLSAGDIVPADLTLVTGDALELDESAITGESFPVEKSMSASREIFYGSHVVSGRGEAKVLAVGEQTKFGALVSELESRDTVTAFERGTAKFGNLLMRSMLVLVLAILLVNIVEHRPVIDSLLFALALAVGLTPQLLPVIISVSLSFGARKLAQANVLVKRLDSIEDFGSIDVLCTDKTGTLTAGAIQLDSWLNTSGEPAGDDVALLARVNAKLQSGFANPMDAAIIRATDSIAGSDLAGIKFVAETAYDFERRRLSVAVEHEAELQLITKGAFDSVLKVCTSARIPGSRQTTAIDEVKAALSGAYEHASAEGYRVLGLATRNMTSSEDLDEVGMTFEGLLLFKDPAKPDAAAAIQNLQGLGIDLFLITGDNPLAAKHVANEVGLAAVTVLTGQEFADADASSRLEAIRQTRVFAEFDPIQKEQLVKLLRSQGHAVGYFGDGINDAAALKAADVGISVDSAVDVARQAASIVLLDRSLDVIAQGVKLGRRTFVNTLKYVRVGVSAAFGNVLSMAIAAIFMPFLPLLPAQILLLNFLTDFPAVMIAGDNVDDESVTKPRGWEIREIRNFMLTFGLLSSVFDMLTFAVLRLVFNADAEQFRSGWFIESALTELVVMLLLRTRRSLFSKGFWRSKPGSGLLWSSVIISMIVIGLPFTPLGPPLGLEPLPVWLLGTLAGLTALYAGANDLLKRKVIV